MIFSSRVHTRSAGQMKNVIGTVMAGYDGHRGWIYSIAVSSAYQKEGLGLGVPVKSESQC